MCIRGYISDLYLSTKSPLIYWSDHYTLSPRSNKLCGIKITKMPKSSRPCPAPNAETAPFWNGARQGDLSLARCADCGRIPYPPKPRCPACLSTELKWITLSGRATLRGWTDIHLAALPCHTPPTCVVECALVEDPRAVLAMIDEGGTARTSQLDSPMQITFAEDSNGWAYPQAQCIEGGSK